MTAPAPGPVLLPYGPTALLVEVGTLRQVRALVEVLDRAALPGVVDLVPAARTVLVEVDRPADLAAVRLEVATTGAAALAGAGAGAGAEATTPAGTEVTIGVCYRGPDLDAVAAATGLTTAEVVDLHSGAGYEVAFCGFSPGFGYLTGLPEALHLPRRDTPRTRVPALSVAVAGGYSAVYPRSGPGGWHLIGEATRGMWDPDSERPALLAPGDRVRFEPCR